MTWQQIPMNIELANQKKGPSSHCYSVFLCVRAHLNTWVFSPILAVYLSNVLGWSLVLVHYLTPDQILYLTICVYNFERVWNNAVWEEGAGGWCALEGFLYPISENRDPYDVWREIRCSLLLTFIKDQKRKKTKRVSTENVSYII